MIRQPDYETERDRYGNRPLDQRLYDTFAEIRAQEDPKRPGRPANLCARIDKELIEEAPASWTLMQADREITNRCDHDGEDECARYLCLDLYQHDGLHYGRVEPPTLGLIPPGYSEGD